MLGTMMQRAGLLSEAQARATREHAASQRIAEVDAILELGLADEDTLVAFLASKLMIPRVRSAVLERVDAQTLARVPALTAWEQLAVPVSQDALGNLTVAMADPTNERAVATLAEASGAYLVRAVATASNLRRALERHYGSQRHVRDRAARASRREGDRPTQPALSPVRSAGPSPSATGPGPATAPYMEAAAQAPPPSTAPAGEDAVTEVDTGAREAPDDERAPTLVETRTSTRGPRRNDRGRAHTPWNPPLRGVANEPVPLSPEAFAQVLPRLDAAANRDAITTVLLDFLAAGFERVILFVHSHSELRGLDARGKDLMVEAVRQVRIPSSGPSMFATVLAGGEPYFGSMQPSSGEPTPIDQAFAAALGGLRGNVLLLPIRVGSKIPLLLWAHGTSYAVDPHSISELSSAVSKAVHRIITARRRS